MKDTSSNEKTSFSRIDDAAQHASAGPEGIAIVPPAYDGGGLIIQPRLMVGAAGDSYEREADHVAQQVMRMDVPSLDGAAVHLHQSTGGDDLTQRKPLASSITSLVQRSGPGQGFQAGGQVAGEVSRQRGRGSTLDGGVRQFMEPRFGADFSSVRVHTNPQADTLNRALSARAFTTGRDIFFRSGEYRPGSASGRELIAHELTHVVQQSGETSGASEGTVQRLIVNTGGDTLPTELSKKEGWIVGSDMDLAYREGGYLQNVRELDALDAYGKVGTGENIYLEGHGSPGKLGSKEPKDVAEKLNKIIPDGYRGTIRSHSCSAGVGVPGYDKPSGVDALADLLDKSDIDVEGAAGIALNHSSFTIGGGKGTRAFSRSQKTTVDKAITDTRDPVDDAWEYYVQTQGGITSRKFPAAAAEATQISQTFYENLEATLDTLLISREDSIVTKTSTGSGFCFITTACTQARGLPDDCLELTTLRVFRDEYILGLAKGREMVKVYYENSPAIVEAINAREDAPQIYDELYEIICRCVRDVQNKEYERAFQTYVQMVIELRNRFTPLATVPAFFYHVYQPEM